MRPFLTTFTLTAALAAGLWWHQRNVLTDLRADLAAVPASAAPAPDKKSSVPKSPRKKPAPDVVLRKPDGSPVTTARSALRSALEAAQYVRTLSREDLEKLLSGEEPDGIGESGGFLLGLWGRLGELDPRAALKLAGKDKVEGFYIVMHDWLIRDRTAALKWFHEQPDSEEKTDFLSVAGLVLASSDPDLLSQLTGSITDPALQGEGLTQSIVSQSLTDPKAAFARLAEITDPVTRASTLQGLMVLYQETHPRQLLELALPGAAEGTERNFMLGSMLASDVGKDPAGALAWLVSRSSAEVSTLRTCSQIPLVTLDNLGTLDASTVKAAVAKLEKPEDREWIMANYYVGTTRTAPLDALQFVTGVTDRALRAEAISHVFARAVRAGRDSEFEPWIAKQPEKEQAALRQQLSTAKTRAAQAPAESQAPPKSPPATIIE